MSEKMMICPNGDGKGKCGENGTFPGGDCEVAVPHKPDFDCGTAGGKCPACIPVPTVVAEPGFEIAPDDHKGRPGG